MKFVSIRQKLISRVSFIFVISFCVVLSLVAYISMNQSDENLKKSEQSIRNALIAKGRTLVLNNSQALQGMVDDNAFSAVQSLVSGTVSDDADMYYGIYMDTDFQPWVNAHMDNPEGVVKGGDVLEDETSLWAGSLQQISYKIVNGEFGEIYEFAAPVVVEEEILGVLRYGFSTQAMQQSLALEAQTSADALVQALLILLGVGLLAILLGFNATRQIAVKITTPLNELTAAAETIAEGDYSSAVAVLSNDEIGHLANNFESMRSTINKKISDLATLNGIGEKLAVLLDQNKALEAVLSTLHDHCGVSQGSVLLINEHNELEEKGVYPPQNGPKRSKPVSFTIGEGVLGQMAQDKAIVFVVDTSKDPRFINNQPNTTTSASTTTSTTTKAMALLCIPLIDKDTLIGVMHFHGEVGAVNFGQSDFEFASSVARLLVITIKNIRMREVIEEQNHTLEEKVAQRTLSLQEKTNDILSMMQNMHQGLFTIMHGGIVHHEYAAYLEEILQTDKIAGHHFMDLLFCDTNLGSDRCDQVSTAIDALIGADEMMFEFNSHLLATEIVISLGDNTKILELDWDPIILNDEIDKIMVTVRDVTALKELQAAAEEQKRELEIIGHILAVDVNKFNEFIRSAMAFIEQCRTLIKSTSQKNDEVIAILFRCMHTIKGNARTFGFNYITNSVHNVENSYDELRKMADKAWQPDVLLYELKLAEVDVQRYQGVARDKLGRNVDDQHEQQQSMVVDNHQITKLLADIGQLDMTALNSDARECFKTTYQTLVTIEGQPIDQIIASVLASAASLSQALDKPTPDMQVNSGDIYIKTTAHELLNNIFMHVFRNAIDHGIESPQVRLAQGKPAQGCICLDTIGQDTFIELVITDDGQGLAIDKLYQKALAEGVYAEGKRPLAADIANLIFGSGFSTAEAVTELSGRGVGMDAVKQFLELEGGTIEIILDEGDELADFRPFATKITLPSSFYIVSPAF